jgi:predicted RNA-binding protein
MTVELEREPENERIMEGVTRLEVLEEGIRLSTFFEEPKILTGVRVKTIDFLSGLTTLTTISKNTDGSKS